MKNDKICIFGEVLFDHFPDGKRVLGGAPFNVAWHLQAFAQNPCFISRVGKDSEGDAVRAAMHDWGMDTEYLQSDPQRPTGQVSVSFVDGEPQYDIVRGCAYDAIEIKSPPPRCRLLYHGSLALREETSRKAAQQIIDSKPDIIFVDVNLRPPWWQRSQVQDYVRAADWVKLNSDEIKLFSPDQANFTAHIQEFIVEYELKGVILTQGSKGAHVFTATGEHYKVEPQKNIKVIDTVGAGDAFASVVILGLVENWHLETTLQRAQEFASQLVGNQGATVSDPMFYQHFAKKWKV